MGRQHPSRAQAIAVALACALALPARAEFVFAAPDEARAVLGAKDDYVRASGALERSARLRTLEAVDEERFARHGAEMARAWRDSEQRAIAPLLEQLDSFLAGQRWRQPPRILVVKAAAAFEDGLPHTRANAIVLPERLRDPLPFLLGHEAFHILSRANPDLREALYDAIGFRRCASIEMPAELADLRITNPDAPENRHAIRVRWRGRDIEAMPFLRFTPGADPRAGFKTQMQTTWLLVERDGERCRASDEGIERNELQGLDEQVGRNTRYLIHPEEILADNFALLFVISLMTDPVRPPSPGILERMRKILDK